ncbi:NAD(P)/FAD-dependent oxidoreductase [Undibacter mobilis]|uniref:FAD-dependent oxidoreductase n=1 Tax=Undibacter mobilis TaxID=2292256 RepID=A0A371B887_9BRAD|nr:FAD-dependent oxidoreductase [Undibacter mobilis]RDV03591.1 FAD-dependent oxidoreductase [Undibacter mobilis]
MSENGTQPLKIAIIGSGISGMAAAWLLSGRHQVTVYERADRIGGHSNTVDARTPNGTVAVDTGFIVYNRQTYPNLTALFEHLNVASEATEMSLGVSLEGGALEYAGENLATVFAQKRNLFSPRFWSMLRDLRRFYKDAPDDMRRLGQQATLGDYLKLGGYGEAFRDDHLLPMAAAIWSAPAQAMLDYPAAAFIRFQENHGLLKLKDRPVWRTVKGGSRSYVTQLTKPYAERIRLNQTILSITRHVDGVDITSAGSGPERFDHVVLATHADQALALLTEPSAAERTLLTPFRYSRNLAVLHSDQRLMPKRRKVWSSWNYISGAQNADALTVTYWMNRLQNLRTDTPLFVTLNPAQPPHAGTIFHSEIYEHPLLDTAAMTAQTKLWSLQRRHRTWFCGAYFGAGFHEDGLQSGLAVAEALGGVRRPWNVENESGRIHMHVNELAAVSEQAT